MWGLLAAYWKVLKAVPPIEILSHRILWSLVFLACLLTFQKNWGAVRVVLADRAALGHYALSSCLLSVNWLTYIYGVNSGHIVEASLGYYINPLVSVLLGVVVLKERLRRAQAIAVVLAALGVAYLTWRIGRLPWIALVLAFSFGFYGLAKKRMKADAVTGLTLETAMVALPALLFVAFREWSGTGSLSTGDLTTRTLLLLAGVITAVPLLLFAKAVRAVNLSTMGILQYMSPTCGLVLGVFVYNEPFGPDQWAGFGPIWLGLALYTVEAFRSYQRTSVK